MLQYQFFILQCDLVPAWATKGWLKVLSAEFPTLAFHASINKSFGKVPSLWIDVFMFHGSAGEFRVCQGEYLFRTCGTCIFYLKLSIFPFLYCFNCFRGSYVWYTCLWPHFQKMRFELFKRLIKKNLMVFHLSLLKITNFGYLFIYFASLIYLILMLFQISCSMYWFFFVVLRVLFYQY